MICVLETTTSPAAGVAPNLSIVAPLSPAPVTVTLVPPEERPSGLFDRRHGRGWRFRIQAALIGITVVIGSVSPMAVPDTVTAATRFQEIAYVANENSDTVSVIDTVAGSVVATIPVGDGPVGVALAPNGTRAYVTNGSSDNVSVIDTAANSVIATVAAGSFPFGVAVSPAAPGST